jgi:hypothetical protein
MALLVASWEAITMDALDRCLEHPALLWGLGGFSLVAIVCSIVLVPRYLAHLPPDFLTAGDREHHSTAWRIARNGLGVVLVLLGIAMLLLPGQGLITLMVGVLLVDFPGKQRLVQRVLGRPKVLKVVNKLREKRGSPPLVA